MESDAVISGELVVAKEKRWTVICSHQDIEITVPIEVPVGQAAANARLAEWVSDIRRNVMEACIAIEE